MLPAYVEESFIGSGDLFIDVYDGAALTGELDVGNTSNMSFDAPSIEKKELKSKRRASYAQTIKSKITAIDQTFKFTLTDINRQNLALQLLGTDSAYTQVAGTNTGSPEEIVAHHGKYSALSHRNLDPETPPVVQDETGVTTYEEGEDYEVDYHTGRIYTKDTGDIEDDDVLKVVSAWLGVTGYQVDAQEITKIEARLRLVGYDVANERNFELVVYKAELTPSGNLNWLTDDFASLEFSGKVLSTSDGTWQVLFF